MNPILKIEDDVEGLEISSWIPNKKIKIFGKDKRGKEREYLLNINKNHKASLN